MKQGEHTFVLALVSIKHLTVIGRIVIKAGKITNDLDERRVRVIKSKLFSLGAARSVAERIKKILR
jgi:hypothetical protein